MEKTCHILIPLILLFSAVAGFKIIQFPATDHRAYQSLFCSGSPGETFHHHHAGELGITDDTLFHQADTSGPVDLLLPSGPLSGTVMAMPLNCSDTFWHPPKFT